MTASTVFACRRAKQSDVLHFPDIEHSAARAFLAFSELAWLAEASSKSKTDHRRLVDAGTTWIVAGPSDAPVGFLSGERIGLFTLHIWELSVRHDAQRQGLGRALFRELFCWSAQNNLSELTLTTFRDVPWNAPFYERLGFKILKEGDLSMELNTILKKETANGMNPEARCAMMKRLPGTAFEG
jgi:GNAT superfamily N-acetyltransferase